MELDALSRQFPGDDLGSDDILPSDFNLPQMEQYHSHLAELYPNAASTSYQYGASTSKVTFDAPLDATGAKNGDAEVLSDEDEDMGNDLGDAEEEEEEEEEDDETDEEASIFLKSRDEQAEIEAEILDLEGAVPDLAQDYKLVDRLGTGTFSAVYKAIDLGYHTKWNNTEWHGNHPSTSSAHYQSVHHPPDRKVFVAVKRIYVTSGPERIRNEISIMEDCRGSRHVSQIITAFRHLDQVVVVMPYQRNDDFRVSTSSLCMFLGICV